MEATAGLEHLLAVTGATDLGNSGSGLSGESLSSITCSGCLSSCCGLSVEPDCGVDDVRLATEGVSPGLGRVATEDTGWAGTESELGDLKRRVSCGGVRVGESGLS